MQRGNQAGNYLNAFLGLPATGGTTTPATGPSGADTQAQIQYLLSVGDSKTGKAMQNYYNSTRGGFGGVAGAAGSILGGQMPSNPNASPEEVLAGLRSLADAGELSKLDAYVSANPYQAGTPAVTTPGVTSQDANNAFGNYIANSDYGFQFGTGSNALNSGYAGAGTVQSGAAMKALEKYRQNLQAGYRNEYTGLLGQQQAVGAGSASALAGVGQNFANATNANTQNAADARSNAALVKGQNNPFANALGMAGGILSSGVLSGGGGAAAPSAPGNILVTRGGSFW